ncbi:MAG: hypothetical protein DHS20C17_14630 [Cyclobacteriaceae bacterium]|nr:MAG: hypothetical protein DHS20C17_14630 [Cyclobacteriaceae bacterium]
MRIPVLSILLLITLQTAAQNFPSEAWHEGKVVLVDEETHKGLVKYDLETDIVQVNNNNTIQTFSSKKILYFEIFDQSVDSYRQFYALPYTVSPGYKTPILFEVLHEGRPLSLLARESITTETIPQYSYYYGRSNYYSRNKLIYEFYFFNEKTGIRRYNMKKSTLLKIMERKSPEVKKFINQNNLRVDRRRDLERITSYYNSLWDT